MRQQKSKKILIYFFLLLLVCSINNIKVNKVELSNISNIKILGLGDENNDFLQKKLYNLNLGNIFFINKKKILNVIESNNLVENYDIFKIYPSTLQIDIKKTKFLARTNYNGENFIIGSNGKLIKNHYIEKTLPFIFGNPNTKEFLIFKQFIDNSKFKFQDIKNLYYYPSGRWDLELFNELIIKLPKKNIQKSLDLLFQLLNDKNFKDIKLIDLRIKNQIIIND